MDQPALEKLKRTLSPEEKAIIQSGMQDALLGFGEKQDELEKDRVPNTRTDQYRNIIKTNKALLKILTKPTESPSIRKAPIASPDEKIVGSVEKKNRIGQTASRVGNYYYNNWDTVLTGALVGYGTKASVATLIGFAAAAASITVPAWVAIPAAALVAGATSKVAVKLMRRAFKGEELERGWFKKALLHGFAAGFTGGLIGAGIAEFVPQFVPLNAVSNYFHISAISHHLHNMFASQPHVPTAHAPTGVASVPPLHVTTAVDTPSPAAPPHLADASTADPITVPRPHIVGDPTANAAAPATAPSDAMAHPTAMKTDSMPQPAASTVPPAETPAAPAQPDTPPAARTIPKGDASHHPARRLRLAHRIGPIHHVTDHVQPIHTTTTTGPKIVIDATIRDDIENLKRMGALGHGGLEEAAVLLQSSDADAGEIQQVLNAGAKDLWKMPDGSAGQLAAKIYQDGALLADANNLRDRASKNMLRMAAKQLFGGWFTPENHDLAHVYAAEAGIRLAHG